MNYKYGQNNANRFVFALFLVQTKTVRNELCGQVAKYFALRQIV